MSDRQARAEELAALVDRIYGGAGDLVNLTLVNEAMKALAEVEVEALESVCLAEFPVEDESEGAWKCVICHEFDRDGHGASCPWSALKAKP